MSDPPDVRCPECASRHVVFSIVESEQEVQPSVNIGHIQWLDMQHWPNHNS